MTKYYEVTVRYCKRHELEVIEAMAQQHNAADTTSTNYPFHAWFVDEDDADQFELEVDAYKRQQQFLDHLSEEEAAELGIVL